MRKWRTFSVWNYDQQENWLNEMAKDGWTLSEVNFLNFEFEKTQPGEYTIKMDLLEKSAGSNESKEYISFIETTGAEFITTYTRWAYFRKPTALGPFELYSDRDSKINYLKRISFALVLVLLSLVLLFITRGVNYLTDGGTGNLLFMILSFFLVIEFSAGLLKLHRHSRLLKKDRELLE